METLRTLLSDFGVANHVDIVALSCAAVAFAAVDTIARMYCEPNIIGGTAFRLAAARSPISFIVGPVGDFFIKEAGTVQRQCLTQGHGAPAIVRALTSDRLIIFDPRDAEYVLMERPHVFLKGERYRLLRPILGVGLVTMEDEETHAVHRRAINPSFSPANVKRFASDIFAPRFHGMVEKWAALVAGGGASSAPKDATAATEVNDIQASLDRTTLEIVGEAAFRTKGFQDMSDVITVMRLKTNPLFLLPAHIFLRLPTTYRRNSVRVRALVQRQVAAVVSDVKRSGPPAEGQGRSLADYLAFSPELSDELLVDQALTFVFAGHETTSTALTWSLVLLAQHPTVQQKLFEELHAALPRDAMPAIESLDSASYLKCVIREVLRVQPPVYHVVRVAEKDEVLPHSGAFIRAGTQVFVSIWGIHHNPAVYGDDSNDFVPERWEDPSLAARLRNCGWMPFIAGKRNCIGRDFALAEMTLALAMLVRRLEVVWPVGQSEPFRRHGVVVRPQGAVNLAFRCRSD